MKQIGYIIAAALGFVAFMPTQAIGAGSHQFAINLHGMQMQTNVGGSVIGLGSPFGLSASYAFRTGFSTSFFFEYGAVTSGTNVVLQGMSAGIDYALLGGQSRTAQISSDSVFEFEFPYRLGMLLAVGKHSYNFAGLNQVSNITFEETVPSAGGFIGAEGGLSLEIPLTETTSILTKGSYIFPSFSDEPTQKGTIITFSVGFGYLL